MTYAAADEGKLVTAIFAVGLVGGSGAGQPVGVGSTRSSRRHRRRSTAGAAAPPPPRRRRRRRRPASAAAAAGRSARGPPPPPPADPVAPPPPPPVNPFAPADPLAHPPMVIPEGTPAGQNPTPYVGEPVFVPPSFNPVNGSMVGVAKPIYINFQRPIANRPMAEQAIHISSNPPVPGRFYWVSDTQVRWRPQDFWPANDHRQHRRGRHQVQLHRTGDSLVATIDNKNAPDGNRAQRQAGEDVPGVDGQEGSRHPQWHLLRAGEVRRHRDGFLDVRGAGRLGGRLQDQGPGRGPDRQQRHVRAQRAVVGRARRASATSATAASTSARPTRSGSSTTSAAATRS